jgi:hypothetical protein
MNEVSVASEKNEESTEACDWVELGEVSTETKGFFGNYYDGGVGAWG